MYASIKAAEVEANKTAKGLFAKMVKGAGGVRKKPPEGVPADAVDLFEDGGLCKRILVEGDDAEGTPFDGAEVQVHYVGTLMDGTKFDSSRDRPGNFKFKIGQGQVIKGWDKGVATMKKGEKAELFCRSDYGYGEHGSPPKIPGGATLKFEVELLSWAEAKEDDPMGEGFTGERGPSHLLPQDLVCGVYVGTRGGSTPPPPFSACPPSPCHVRSRAGADRAAASCALAGDSDGSDFDEAEAIE